MQKFERDGMVAVLISPGFGAGWSTWNRDHEATLCMDAEIVRAVLDGNKERASEIALKKCPGICTLGADDLMVKWVPCGSAFEVREYDGSESLHVIGESQYMTA